MAYTVRSKTTGDLRTVDDATRAALISELGYSKADFTPQEVAPVVAPRPRTAPPTTGPTGQRLDAVSGAAELAPLAPMPRVSRAPAESTGVALDAVSGAAQIAREKDLKPGPARKAAQRGYEALRTVASGTLGTIGAPLIMGMSRIDQSEHPYGFMQARDSLMKELQTTPLGRLVSDPLNFIPAGGIVGQASKVLKGGKLAKLAQGAAKASEIAHMPGVAAGEIAEGIKAGQRVRSAMEGARPALDDIIREQAWRDLPAAERAASVQPNVTGYGAQKALGSLAAAEGTRAALPTLARASSSLAALPAPLRAVAEHAAAPVQGAALGAGYAGAGSYLGTDKSTDDILRDMAHGGVAGGLLGSVGSWLSHRGVESNPALDPRYTNRWLTDEARGMIRRTLPEVYGESFLPMRRSSLGAKAEGELEKLSQGPYREAAKTLQGTNAAAMRGAADVSPEAMPAELRSHLENSFDDARRGAADLDMSKRQRGQLESAIDEFVDSKIGDHPNKDQLRDQLRKDLNQSKSFSEFNDRAFGEGNSTTSRWLSAPRFQIPVDELEQNLNKRMVDIGEDPQASDFWATMGNVPSERFLPETVAKGAQAKIENLLPLQWNQDVSDLARRLELEGGISPEAARKQAAAMLTEKPTHIDPLLLSDYRTASTRPLAYKDNTSAEVAAQKAAVDNAFRDVVNEKLESFPPFREAIGGARGDYAKWKTWSNLAQHPGAGGLANRWAGFAEDPILMSSAQYKLGNLLQRAIPYAALLRSHVAQPDATKAKR